MSYNAEPLWASCQLDCAPDYVTNSLELDDFMNCSGSRLTLDTICPDFLDQLCRSLGDKKQRMEWRDWKAAELRRQRKQRLKK